jgi:hypothetical protein
MTSLKLIEKIQNKVELFTCSAYTITRMGDGTPVLRSDSTISMAAVKIVEGFGYEAIGMAKSGNGLICYFNKVKA